MKWMTFWTKSTRLKQSPLGSFIITFRRKIGQRMKQMRDKLDSIAQERNNFHLHHKIADTPAASLETGFISIEPEVFGRDKEKHEIVEILINNVNDAQELPVLPITGMGGLGKTTLVRMVFNDERVNYHFNLKIWICVSEDFDEKRMIKSMVESIEGQPLGDMNLAPLQKKLQDLLNEKRFLLVLDDVWNEDQENWAKLRAVLKVGARGASVLVTTRVEKIGTIMGTLQPYQLSNLSQHDCWLLFTQCAFGDQSKTNPDLVAIGKEIVKKCGGVPLAAKTLGSLLRFKREESEWKYVRDSEIWNLPQHETSIMPSLKLSYYHLPLNLRQCFTYCAVFPKDSELDKDNIITLWIAHGFLSAKGNLELEEVGNEVWEELCLRSFFQLVKDRFGTIRFVMHDLIHDLATSLISANKSSSNIRQVKLLKGNIKSIGFSKVVSQYSPSLLKKFMSLRVLDLSGLNVKQLPSSVGDLIHLRLLNLSGSSVQTLPRRLCKLQNLQTLNLSNSDISCLPKQTSQLSSLRNLIIYAKHPLSCMPPRIGLLTYLKTLDYFVVGKKKGYRLSELQNLNLRGSLTITHLERVKGDDAKKVNLSGKDLIDLRLSWDRPGIYEPEECIDEEVLETLKPHPNLKILTISGFSGFCFPKWMNGSALEKIVSVEIVGCKNCLCLPAFGKLPCLENLQLYEGSAAVEYVEEDFHPGFPRRRFPSLKRLVLRGFPNLKGLLKNEGEEQFPKLEEVEIALPLVSFSDAFLCQEIGGLGQHT